MADIFWSSSVIKYLKLHLGGSKVYKVQVSPYTSSLSPFRCFKLFERYGMAR
ncbi:MAG: hypothetical protein ACUVSC_09215 [Candidatus Fervidibacter sp.]|uniref:hypothetical protein n=1 Tax=Candidatus Fervidibacter sp. TaxID=3100871 RepID=UPI00404A122A